MWKLALSGESCDFVVMLTSNCPVPVEERQGKVIKKARRGGGLMEGVGGRGRGRERVGRGGREGEGEGGRDG